MKSVDDEVLRPSCHTLIHRILKKMRECEVENIDYEVYLNRLDLIIMNDVLDCCLKNKDSKHIARRNK